MYAVIAVVSATALLPSLNKSMFRDEGASLYSAHLSWLDLWQQSLVVDRVLLGYYALLHLWLEVSSSIEWARALSLIAYSLTIYTVGVIGRRVAGPWCGLFAAVLTGTNPLMITAALNARPYALATLLAVLSIGALLRWIDRGGLGWMWAFSLLAVAALLLQLFTALAPLGVLATCVVMNLRDFRRQWRALLAPIGLLLATTVALVALVAHQQGQVAWIRRLTLKQFFGDIKGPASPELGHLIYPLLIAAAGLCAVATCAYRSHRGTLRLSRFDVDRLVIFSSWAAAPTLLLVLISAVKPIYVDRYVTASVPGMSLALALLLTFALRGPLKGLANPMRAAVIGVSAVAAVSLIANSIDVSSASLENLKGAASEIMNEATPASDVALPDHSLTAGVEYYLRSAGSKLHLWPQLSEQPHIEGLDLRLSERTCRLAPDSVWLVSDGSVAGIQTFISRIERSGFVRVMSTSLGGVKVIHFMRK